MELDIPDCTQLYPGSLLIKMAFQHAERHPDTPDAAEFRRRFDQTRAIAPTTPEPGSVGGFPPPGGQNCKTSTGAGGSNPSAGLSGGL